jgi:hypothetical protein
MNLKTSCIAIASVALIGGCGGDQQSSTGNASSAAYKPLSMIAGPTTLYGLSSVSYSGNRANYTITSSGGIVTVKDNVGSDGTASYTNLKRIYFADSAVAFDIDGVAGQVYRLYKAAFDRQPDVGGLGFQIAAVEASGLSVLQIAQNFSDSPEYLLRYGNTTNRQFVTQLYRNALHREPDTAGLEHHLSYLDANTITRAQILLNFSESAENQSQVLSDIQNGITYTPYNVPAITSAPGAPTLTSATAGNGTAAIAFTAPTSTGGLAISGYTATCAASGSTKSATGTSSPITVSGLTNGTAYSCSVTATNSAGTSAASSSASVTPSLSSSSLTGAYFCSHSASVLNSTLNLTSTVSATCTSTQRTMTGNGVPDHATGTFPNSGNPTAIKAVNFTFKSSLSPAVTSSSGTSVAHVVGYVNNGVKLDPATAESYQNAGVWKIEALNQSYFAFGTDSSNAHVQPDGAYHYHGMPEGYVSKLGKGTAMTFVGFALDGFPIYARYGYSDAMSASSAVRIMNASYRLKSSPSSGRPSTSTVPMGTFTQDYEYVAGLGDLDECNGRYGVTPEFPTGIYHYYITDGYPYIQRCIKGTATP